MIALRMQLQRSRGRQAFSLVEILVVMVIIVIMLAMVSSFVGNRRTKEGKAATPMAKAHDTECIANIRSVRQSIEAFKAMDSDGKNPQSLTDLKELPKDFIKCPVGHVEYVYDPRTGEVHCPFPSHERY
jgi:prepilin-type N-terminal cleavage/methylation domain-containing protein